MEQPKRPYTYRNRAKKVERTCVVCGQSFLVQPATLKRPRTGLYCGRECRWKGTQKPWPDRFWDKVNKDGPVPSHCPELGQCWEWTGARHEKGYGVAQAEDWRQQTFASRISWELAHGPVPEGQHVLHHCDNPPCVRPEHLFLGTKADNRRDMVAKGRQPRPEAHASPGEAHPAHKLTEDQVSEMRVLWAAGGMTQADLARRYNCARSLVSLIVTRRAWKHIL